MSREARLKGTISGLQPRGFDLTDLAPARSVSRAAPIPRVSMDMAAGALAYSSLDRYEDAAGNAVASDDPAGFRRPGDPFGPLLLRLKYGRHVRPALFNQARTILLHRHAGLDTRSSATLDAVASAALFEWLHDECSKCRGARAARMKPCPARCAWGRVGYGGLKEPLRTRRSGRRTTRVRILEDAMTLGAMPEEIWFAAEGARCTACAGLGYAVEKPREVRGMMCVSCSNSGQEDWRPNRRWQLISYYLKRANAAPLTCRAFLEGWNRKYWRLIGVLRAADRIVGVGLDLGFWPSQGRDIDIGGGAGRISAIEPGREEKQDDRAPVETSAAVGLSEEESPQQPTGPLPPQES